MNLFSDHVEPNPFNATKTKLATTKNLGHSESKDCILQLTDVHFSRTRITLLQLITNILQSSIYLAVIAVLNCFILSV